MLSRVARKYTLFSISSAALGILALQLLSPSRDIAQEPPTAPPPPAAPNNEAAHIMAASQIDAGRYLVKIAGCNDCHTPEWAESSGNVPEEKWLTGVSVGFKGPWGTSYPSNLRLYVKDFTPDLWVQVMRARNAHPPMPWTSLHAMSDADLRAIHAYIKSMGPAGDPTPAFVPPNQEPRTAFYDFVPKMPPGANAAPNPEPAEQSGPRR